MSNYKFKGVSISTIAKYRTNENVATKYLAIFPSGTVTSANKTFIGSVDGIQIDETPLAAGIPYSIDGTNISTHLIAAYSDNTVGGVTTTIPGGCTKLRVVVIGGGGGGGGGVATHQGTATATGNQNNQNTPNEDQNNNYMNTQFPAGDPGSGGGGGGFLYLSQVSVGGASSTTITVGAGGASNTSGQNSSFTVNSVTYTAAGGYGAQTNTIGAASATHGTGYTLNKSGQAGYTGVRNSAASAGGGTGGSGGWMGGHATQGLTQYGRGGDGGAGKQWANRSETEPSNQGYDSPNNGPQSWTGNGEAAAGSTGTNGFIRVYYLFD